MKVVFITNRGGTHPNRKLYFNSIGANYEYVDFKVRWHGRPSSKLRMIWSGIVCALSFPNRKKYKLFVTSDLQLPAILMRKIGFLRGDQKVVCYLGSQTLYFIYSKYFSKWNIFYQKWLLKNYDAFICNGSLQADLVKKILPHSEKSIFINLNGVLDDRSEQLQQVAFDPDSKRLLFIGNLYSNWRCHYKGIDLLLASFNVLKKRFPELILDIVGMSDDNLQFIINDKVNKRYQKDVFVHGEQSNISSYLSRAILYVHPSRGDALPNSVLEACYAGIPSVISSVTGYHEKITEIHEGLVCECSVDSCVDAITQYLELPQSEKREISFSTKSAFQVYTQEKAVERFKEVIEQLNKL